MYLQKAWFLNIILEYIFFFTLYLVHWILPGREEKEFFFDLFSVVCFCYFMEGKLHPVKANS